MNVVFSPTEPEGTDTKLAEHSLHDCVAATVAASNLDNAEAMLALSNTGSDVANSTKLLQRALKLIESLPDSDPAAPDLRARLAATQTAFAKRATMVLSAEAARAIAAIRASLSTSFDTIAVVSSLAVSAADGQQSWISVYSAFAEAAAQSGAEGYAQTVRLLAADPTVRDAIDGSENGWLKREIVAAALRPVLDKVAHEVEHIAGEYAAATKAVRAKVDSKTVQQLDAAVAKLTVLRSICKDLRVALDPLETQCAASLRRMADGDAAVAERTEKIDQLRAKIERDARSARLRQVSASWADHFRECRLLDDGIGKAKALRSSGQCGPECEAGITRLQAAYDRLNAFHLDQEVEDHEVLAMLQQQCVEARCRVCPEQ